MPSPKNGTPGSLVSPAAPDAAIDADVADPGAVEQTKSDQREMGTGKYGSQKAKPHKKPTSQEEKDQKPGWIEVVLKDEDGHPVPGERYRIVLPDDSVQESTLDEKGFARVDGIEPGTCKITFPDRDADVWSPA